MTDTPNERAASVWREACAAFEDAADPELPKFENVNAGDQAAAAVIAREFEADRVRIEALREALSNALALIGHRMSMNATALVAGDWLVAGDVWKAGCAALKEPSHDADA